jgi:hypothetical protein
MLPFQVAGTPAEYLVKLLVHKLVTLGPGQQPCADSGRPVAGDSIHSISI